MNMNMNMNKIKTFTLAALIAATSFSCTTQDEQDEQIECVVQLNKLSEAKRQYEMKMIEANRLMSELRIAQDRLANSSAGAFNENLFKVDRIRANRKQVLDEARLLNNDIQELEKRTQGC